MIRLLGLIALVGFGLAAYAGVLLVILHFAVKYW